MPSGPKKRHAARRRSLGRPGSRPSLDKTSASGSVLSDDGASPKTGDERRLSLASGSGERPSDQTFQTEEWVRVSDFDVGTPTSTTAKSDFDGGEARGLDKLAEWETVSRENAGNSSSGGEAGEVSSSGGTRRKQLRVESDSEKEEESKSVCSRSVGGKSGSRSSSRSAGSRSGAYPKKSDDEERSSGGIVVVPSHGEHEEDSQESSYVEVASVEAREDDFRGSVANLSSPEGKEGGYQGSSNAIEPASSDEQEEDNYERFSGVEDHASSAIEPASSDEQEEEKYSLFTDLSNVKELVDVQSGSNAVDLSSLIPAQSEGEERASPGHLKSEDEQVPEWTEAKPEASDLNKSSHEAIHSEPYDESLSENHPPERDGEGDASVAEDSTLIEPTTPERTSEKSFAENPYTFVRSVSNEEILEPTETSPPEVEETAPAPSLLKAQGGEENVAKEAHDSSSTGLPEPNPEELKQLLEIAHSKEIAALGKQEEHILAQEEQDLGKHIVEPQPLVEVLAATKPSKSVEEGDAKELQPVVAEEAPLLKDSSSSSSVDSDLHNTADETKDFQPVVAEEAPPKDSSAAYPDVDNASVEVKVFHPVVADDDSSTLVGSESHKTTDSSTGKIAGSSEKHEQVSHRSKEDQPRIIGPIQVSSDTWGCCEPVQWLFAHFRRSVNPRAIRN